MLCLMMTAMMSTTTMACHFAWRTLTFSGEDKRDVLCVHVKISAFNDRSPPLLFGSYMRDVDRDILNFEITHRDTKQYS